jgi:lactoylglutathione lyase
MIKGITHLALRVEDMEASLEFYCDVLGLEKAFELEDDTGAPWIVYVKLTEGQFIELFYGEKGAKRITSPLGFEHLCLEVEDIEKIADRLRDQGVTLDVEPQQGKDGNYQCWAQDPDGTPIEFMELTPGSLQSKS